MVGFDVGVRPALTFTIPPTDIKPAQDEVICGKTIPADGGFQVTDLVTTIFGAGVGDFGTGTSRPVSISYPAYILALKQHRSDASFCPLTVHSAPLDVTPPCALTSEITDSVGSAVAKRVQGTCFASSSSAVYGGSDGSIFSDPSCPGDDPTCPETCDSRAAQWGASDAVFEDINFGDVAITDHSWAACPGGSNIVWVSYSFGASGEWTCGTSGCAKADGQSRDCVNEFGDPCGPAGSGSTGSVCGNVIGIGDPGSPPAGTVSSVDLVFAGTGWGTDSGVVSLFFSDSVSVPCAPQGYVVTY